MLFFTGNLLYRGSLCGSFVSQGFVIGFRNILIGVRLTRNGLCGVSYTGDILLCYQTRTGISLYLYVVIYRGTLYLRISQQILPRGLNRGLDVSFIS